MDLAYSRSQKHRVYSSGSSLNTCQFIGAIAFQNLSSFARLTIYPIKKSSFLITKAIVSLSFLLEQLIVTTYSIPAKIVSFVSGFRSKACETEQVISDNLEK